LTYIGAGGRNFSVYRELLNELEARDVVFRSDLDEEANEKKMPWLMFGARGDEIEAEDLAIWQQLFKGAITEEQALNMMTDLMEKYFGQPYPIMRYWNRRR
jgi:hypothetical protein